MESLTTDPEGRASELQTMPGIALVAVRLRQLLSHARKEGNYQRAKLFSSGQVVKGASKIKKDVAVVVVFREYELVSH